jgi:hypothetical protein
MPRLSNEEKLKKKRKEAITELERLEKQKSEQKLALARMQNTLAIKAQKARMQNKELRAKTLTQKIESKRRRIERIEKKSTLLEQFLTLIGKAIGVVKDIHRKIDTYSMGVPYKPKDGGKRRDIEVSIVLDAPVEDHKRLEESIKEALVLFIGNFINYEYLEESDYIPSITEEKDYRSNDKEIRVQLLYVDGDYPKNSRKYEILNTQSTDGVKKYALDCAKNKIRWSS